MTANVRITHAEQVDNGLFVTFDDGQAAHFPATFLRSYVPWYSVDPPDGPDDEPPATAKLVGVRTRPPIA